MDHSTRTLSRSTSLDKTRIRSSRLWSLSGPHSDTGAATLGSDTLYEPMLTCLAYDLPRIWQNCEVAATSSKLIDRSILSLKIAEVF